MIFTSAHGECRTPINFARRPSKYAYDVRNSSGESGNGTRKDAFEDVWPGVQEILERDESIEAKRLFDYFVPAASWAISGWSFSDSDPQGRCSTENLDRGPMELQLCEWLFGYVADFSSLRGRFSLSCLP
jgi:hypothetical protein